MPAKGDDPQAQTAAPSTPPRDSRREERRLRPKSFHMPERRTGFDRRMRYPLTGRLRDQPGFLLGILILVNVMSALDFALTWLQLQAGVVQEGNPVLAGMFAESPGRAWLFKTAVMLGVSAVIWHQRKHRAVLGVAIGALIFYFVLLVYHFWGMATVGLI